MVGRVRGHIRLTSESEVEVEGLSSTAVSGERLSWMVEPTDRDPWGRSGPSCRCACCNQRALHGILTTGIRSP